MERENRMMPITFERFLELTTPNRRELASHKAIIYGCERSGTTQIILDSCEVLKKIANIKTMQDDYVQKLYSFYNHAITHFHVISKNSMLEDFLNSKRIYWNSYK